MTKVTELLRQAAEAHRSGETQRGNELLEEAEIAEREDSPVESPSEEAASTDVEDGTGEADTAAERIAETEAEAAAEIAETHAETEVAVAEAESEARQVEAEAESEARQVEAAAAVAVTEAVADIEESTDDAEDGSAEEAGGEDVIESAEETVEEVAEEAGEAAEEVVTGEPRKPEPEHWWFRKRKLGRLRI